MAKVDIFNLTDLWNDAGAVFTAIKMNVTNTASAAGSKLIDLMVSGVSKFRVDPDGKVEVDGAGLADSAVMLDINMDTRNPFKVTARDGAHFAMGSSRTVDFLQDTLKRVSIGNTGGVATVRVGSGGQFAFSSADPISGADDVLLRRDGSASLAQRNGVNAQTSRIYHTFTDLSNYERMRMTGRGVALESAGTGSANIDFVITPAGTGRVKFGTHAAIASETVTGYLEIKDSAGNVRKLAVVS